MKIKALWGFAGNAALLGAGVQSSKVVRGQVFDDADDEYAHLLIGKGLAEEVVVKVDPKAKKAEEKAAADAEAKAKADAEAASLADAEAKEKAAAGPDDNKQATPEENK